MITLPYDKLLDKFWHRKSAPVSMYFAVTYRCNLKCKHCFVDTVKPEKELGIVEISSILEDLSKAGVLTVAFTGGEPFIRKDFVDILRIAKKMGLLTYIATNGTFITSDLVAILSKERLADEVSVSIYGPEALVHEKMTGVKGSFYKSIEGIRMLREKDINVRIACVVTNINIGYLTKIKLKAQELDVNVNFGINIFPRNNGDIAPLTLRAPTNKLKKINEGNILSSCKIKKQPCAGTRQFAYIDPEGKLYPCIYLPIEVGDLTKNAFKDIWSGSPKLLEIRTCIKHGFKKCRDCLYKKTCNVCIAMNYLEMNDMRKLSREKCRLTKYAHIG